MAAKERIDILVFERGLAPSREKARAMIMAREVLVNGDVVDKAGTKVSTEAEITVTGKPRFVSRGGDKLAAALDAFPVDVRGHVAADVGASTGGFTDALLQYGAARVYAIDVGYGQIDYRLRQDPRVVVIERTNARHVERLDEPVSVVSVDASFISLRLLLPVIKGWLTPQANLIPLIKPQFEAGPQDVGKGGVVRDHTIHARVLNEVLGFATENGFTVRGLITSPLKGPAGNTEFLAWLAYGQAEPGIDLDSTISRLMTSLG